MTKLYKSGSKKKKAKDILDHPYHQLLLHSFSSEKWTGHKDWYKTIEASTNRQFAIGIHSPLSQNWLQKHKMHSSSPSSTSKEASIRYALKKETNTKQCSRQNMAYMNPWSCTFASATPPLPFKIWWTTSSDCSKTNGQNAESKLLSIWTISWSPCPLHCKIIEMQHMTYWTSYRNITSSSKRRSVAGRSTASIIWG